MGRVPITAAKKIAKAHKLPMVIVFGLEGPAPGTFHLATYGETKQLCKLAKSLADQIADKIQAGEISPPATEPATGGKPVSEKRG